MTNLTNVRWLTGFTGSNGWVAVLPDRLVLGTDGRYRDRAEAELAAAGVDAEILTGFTRAEQHDQLIGTLRGISAGRCRGRQRSRTRRGRRSPPRSTSCRATATSRPSAA